MIAVLFEAQAAADHQARYLVLAAELNAALAHIPGFIAIERFKSLSREGTILSLSWWESEASVLEWKRNALHQMAQEEGKRTIFSHYRIRIAQVIREYSSDERGGSHHV
ncbi:MULTISPECIES: antibiotic biosynthesis monooxygenase family protein [Enterobacteriaceae]|uniref:antibiotic biosynthesis monooxygenase family protein n=1 Tax=Enterobacteriaceae TaxID=543 RepID=UPI0015DD44A8|nr:antibiotic biosynthesis monooxygenase [Klebsiella sp. WP8-S18-ESBL-06]BBT70929.1 antibiotic biosynthesis monooxygenase [Klebsiella sp. WP8-S18-ESBL-06]